MVLGNHQHTLDDKNRIRLPADFRKEMGDDYYLMPGTNGCIFVYKADDTQSVLAKLLSLDTLNPQRTKQLTMLTAYSRKVSADNQGRFMLPDDLIKIMNIKKDVRIIGSGTKVKICSEESWKAMFGDMDIMTPDSFNDIYAEMDQELLKQEINKQL